MHLIALTAVAAACLQASTIRPLSNEELAELHQHRLTLAQQLLTSIEQFRASGMPQGESIERLVQIQADLVFQPLMESPTPDGFPSYSPVGEIVLLEYPSYRMATASNKEGSNTGFWTLFRHITSNDISMTAPVRMDFAVDSRGKLAAQEMSFLYGSRDLGQAGAQQKVLVQDVAGGWCLSIGVRGEPNPKQRQALAARLENWLQGKPELEATGQLRVMGWNSPFIAKEKRFYEVQIPVRRTVSNFVATTTN
ncbi:MAG: heme-binding protein [Planctomycetes bacterium]|nr:heme-binding protein [Planctomycetota bacterium]